MSAITARSVRRDLTKRGKNSNMPNGLPGIKRGSRRPSWFTKKWTPSRRLDFIAALVSSMPEIAS